LPHPRRACAGVEAAFPRPLADQLRRPDLVPRADPAGRRRPGRPALPGRADRRCALGGAPAPPLPAVPGRGPRLPGGRAHHPQLRGGAVVLRPDLRLHAGRRDRAGQGRVPGRRDSAWGTARGRDHRVTHPLLATTAATGADAGGGATEAIAVVLILLVAA